MNVVCAGCKTKLSVLEEHRGKKIKCPDCQHIFVVPSASQAFIPTVIPLNAPSQRPKPSSQPNPVPVVPVIPLQTSTTSTSTQHNSQSDVASTVAPKKPSPEKLAASIDERKQRVMAGFVGEFHKPKTAREYRVGLALAALTMLLLPLLYGLFIYFIATSVWWHISNNYQLLNGLRGRTSLLAFAAYLTPAIAGIITVVFMLKPMFARPERRGKPRSLYEKDEPILFAFVHKICADVGAPLPKRIDIDNEVNASASFRNGWFSLFRGNDLVLTIGLPLVHGLTLQQFAGVLAHEFGHFSQGAGMRVSFVLRSINFWFIRAVYERDSLDSWLERMSTDWDIRIGWIFYVARGAVWLSRKFLWCLLMLGNLLTGIIQQQMEYDADKFEVAMSGKQTFASTFRAIHVASAGYEMALSTLSRIASEGRLVNDFPLLASLHSRRLLPSVHEKIEELIRDTPSQRFASHPSDRDRIKAAESASDDGAFRSDLPARSTFLYFTAQCERLTQAMYQEAPGMSLKDHQVIATQLIMKEETHEDGAWRALERFFMDAIRPDRPLPFPQQFLVLSTEREQAKQLILKARNKMFTTLDHYTSFWTIKEKEESLANRQAYVQALKQVIKKVDESILKPSKDEVAPKLPSPNADLAESFIKASIARICSACSLLAHPEIADKFDDARGTINRLNRILPVLHRIDHVLPLVKLLQKQLEYQFYMLGHLDRVKRDPSNLIHTLLQNSQLIVNTYLEIRNIFIDVAYPFEHATVGITVGQQLTTDYLVTEEIGTVLEAAESLINGYFMLRGRCLSQLVFAAETVEKHLDLEPMVRPIAPAAKT